MSHKLYGNKGMDIEIVTNFGVEKIISVIFIIRDILFIYVIITIYTICIEQNIILSNKLSKI